MEIIYEISSDYLNFLININQNYVLLHQSNVKISENRNTGSNLIFLINYEKFVFWCLIFVSIYN